MVVPPDEAVPVRDEVVPPVPPDEVVPPEVVPLVVPVVVLVVELVVVLVEGGGGEGGGGLHWLHVSRQWQYQVEHWFHASFHLHEWPFTASTSAGYNTAHRSSHLALPLGSPTAMSLQ